MSTTIGQRLRLRLFIEGVEIPIISAQLQAVPNAPVVASLQVLPLTEGTKLLPRSLVHLFFLDPNEQDNPLLSLRQDSVATGQESSNWERIKKSLGDEGSTDLVLDNDISTDYLNYRYKLCFVGEVVGFNWTKTPINRSLVLQCQDLSNYWDYAFQYRNDDLFGPGLKQMFSGGAGNLFTDFLSEPGSVVVSIIQRPSTQYPALKGLLGGIVHLCEAIGGSYFYKDKYAGQNIFFSMAELRLHITQLITAYDKDPTSQKLLGGGYDGLFGRTIGNLGEQASIRKTINALSAMIFHETFGQHCPYYVPGTAGSITGQQRVPLSGPIGLFLKTNAQAVIDSCNQVIEILNGKADGISSFDEADKLGLDTKKARAQYRQQVLTQLSGAKKTCSTTAARARTAKVDVILKHFNAAAVFLQAAAGLLNTWKPELASTQAIDAAISKLQSAITELRRVLNADVNLTPQKLAIPARLCQQIFRPDVWFSSPPRCNVIFPDDYMQLNYARSFLAEPTRLLLKTNDEFFGEDFLFDNFYFAPKALTLKSQKNDLQAILANDIMDHELFTGINPLFEKMGELNIFAARSGMTPGGKTPKIGLAQRTTNFLYFKYRFAARQMTVNARFLPYLACGFPGLIVDKYIDVATIERYNELYAAVGAGVRETQELLGTHFLGNFTEVSHQMSQDSGTTSVTLGYARQAEETLEFLGARQEDVSTVQQKTGQEKLRYTVVASLFPPAINSQGPNKGRITFVQEVTSAYAVKNGDFQGAEKLPVYANDTSVKLTTKVPVGLFTRADQFGPDIAQLVGDPGIIVGFRAFRLHETVSQYKKANVDLPPEEYIRPGWYGDIWHPMNIHLAYQQFFGTGSITEPTQILDLQGAQVGVVTSDAQTALNTALAALGKTGAVSDSAASISLVKGASIQQAVAFLVLTYSYIKQQGLSTQDFLKVYNYRPIANMVDMFGSSDLQLSPDGTQIVQGIEGFHSRAFGPFEDLFGLVTNDIESIVGIKRGTVQAQKADTRKRKFEVMLRYAANLRFSRAILG